MIIRASKMKPGAKRVDKLRCRGTSHGTSHDVCDVGLTSQRHMTLVMHKSQQIVKIA